MSSVANYIKDESGVHLSLHLTPDEYRAMTTALLLDASNEAERVRLLLARAKQQHETKPAPADITDPDAPPVGGA